MKSETKLDKTLVKCAIMPSYELLKSLAGPMRLLQKFKLSVIAQPVVAHLLVS